MQRAVQPFGDFFIVGAKEQKRHAAAEKKRAERNEEIPRPMEINFAKKAGQENGVHGNHRRRARRKRAFKRDFPPNLFLEFSELFVHNLSFFAEPSLQRIDYPENFGIVSAFFSEIFVELFTPVW